MHYKLQKCQMDEMLMKEQPKLVKLGEY